MSPTCKQTHNDASDIDAEVSLQLSHEVHDHVQDEGDQKEEVCNYDESLDGRIYPTAATASDVETFASNGHGEEMQLETKYYKHERATIVIDTHHVRSLAETKTRTKLRWNMCDTGKEKTDVLAMNRPDSAVSWNVRLVAEGSPDRGSRAAMVLMWRLVHSSINSGHDGYVFE
ncbi:hypothetical protein LSH36_387g02078 [Paralvinella palmiformis]|uniref:Uncharacterized protein n=1 Tax=Paralvinella palmiformis TaxID=53620 RepID=A0AAD9JEC5_9ANNE|nr:hypothetical protein LSH36_387g02078 [Paralvinella palmiformis]